MSKDVYRDLAAKAENLKASLERGDINESEFKELVQDIIIAQTIKDNAIHLEENAEFREAITSAINMAMMIP